MTRNENENVPILHPVRPLPVFGKSQVRIADGACRLGELSYAADDRLDHDTVYTK
jgi:hypothetical protein